MELYNGRPADSAGRQEREIRVYDLLDELGVSYVRVDHEAIMTMEGCKEADALLGASICKNLFLCNRQKTKFYLVMMPGDKVFKTKELSSQLGVARMSFAGEDLMTELLDLHPGSVSVMGLMNDTENKVRLVIDQPVIEQPYICCHPCKNTSTIRFSAEDLLKKILPAIHHEPTIVDLPGGIES